MNDGNRLVGAWLSRAITVPALVVGVVLVDAGVKGLALAMPGKWPIWCVMAAGGVLVVVMAWRADGRAASEIARQAAARRERQPRGFAVVGPGEGPRPTAGAMEKGTNEDRKT
ncbi:MAG: hypothetical protein JWO31_1976 [Phycisphaerales bacterium]|nr:hypothetical protein [Phycisphaerales bacterium]